MRFQIPSSSSSSSSPSCSSPFATLSSSNSPSRRPPPAARAAAPPNAVASRRWGGELVSPSSPSPFFPVGTYFPLPPVLHCLPPPGLSPNPLSACFSTSSFLAEVGERGPPSSSSSTPLLSFSSSISSLPDPGGESPPPGQGSSELSRAPRSAGSAVCSLTSAREMGALKRRVDEEGRGGRGVRMEGGGGRPE